MMRPAVFLDRDGVLCENRASYVKDWSEFRWLPGAREALRILARLDLVVAIVTNQSAINRGYTTFDHVHELHDRMRDAIRQSGGRVDAVYVCPHRPEERCLCRKPGLLLFQRAAEELGLNLSRSFLIGDNMSDIQAGWDLGVRVILVRTGLGERTAAMLEGVARRVQIARNVLDAARWIAATSLRPQLVRRQG